jgi:hypothetical protein
LCPPLFCSARRISSFVVCFFVRAFRQFEASFLFVFICSPFLPLLLISLKKSHIVLFDLFRLSLLSLPTINRYLNSAKSIDLVDWYTAFKEKVARYYTSNMLYVCVCVYINIYIYIYIYHILNLRVCVFIHTYIFVCIYIYIYIYIYTHTYIHTFIRCVYMSICICMHIGIHCYMLYV